ncbi:MAG: hypothetical protein HYX71_02660 [Opitutae bacterium]|nr:hypothetical protein [Opitutae bacterium]
MLLFASVLGVWHLLALGAWLFVRYQRDFPHVKYADLWWPGRWPRYRASMGDYYIAQSDALLHRGEYALAVHKLRVGVAKAPASAQGRTLLARVFLAYRRPDLAKQVLLDGLDCLSADPAYLQSTLAFLLEFQEDATLLEVTRRLLAAPAGPATRPLLATFAATAAFNRGNHTEAEELLGQNRLRDSPEGVLLQARIAWESGLPELALLRLKEDIALHPGHDRARVLLAEYYLSLGRTGEWETALVERVAGDPLAPAPRVAYLQLLHRRGDHARLEQEAAALLRQFGGDPAALLALADFAASTGRPDLARRAQLALSAQPENSGAAALMVAEAHLVAGEYQSAVDLVTRYTREYPEWTGQFAPVFDGLQTVAYAGLGRADEARLSLDHLLGQKNLRAANLVAVAQRLNALGARDLARFALGRAVEADPLNQPALANLIRLELETGALADLPARLERYLRSRQPSREILARAADVLGSDLHLLVPGQKKLLGDLQTALGPRRP